KSYLNVVGGVRMRYQFFYRHEGLDVVSPVEGVKPSNATFYPNGYYVLSDRERNDLTKVQPVQLELKELVETTRGDMQSQQTTSSTSTQQSNPQVQVATLSSNSSASTRQRHPRFVVLVQPLAKSAYIYAAAGDILEILDISVDGEIVNVH